ncbi:MAG: hypothetical protein O3B41_11690 [Bacteroidetes bacterium]|nr:hypothetical protein [Bacteroidota bacterium]
MTTVEVVRKVRDLFGDIGRWTQDVAARDVFGNARNAKSAYAVCWCLFGGFCKVGGGGDEYLEFSAWSSRRNKMGAIVLNDRLGYKAVIAALDDFIKDHEE